MLLESMPLNSQKAAGILEFAAANNAKEEKIPIFILESTGEMYTTWGKYVQPVKGKKL